MYSDYNEIFQSKTEIYFKRYFKTYFKNFQKPLLKIHWSKQNHNWNDNFELNNDSTSYQNFKMEFKQKLEGILVLSALNAWDLNSKNK